MQTFLVYLVMGIAVATTAAVLLGEKIFWWRKGKSKKARKERDDTLIPLSYAAPRPIWSSRVQPAIQ